LDFAVILAGGNGSRMNSKITKQRMVICGHSVIWHSVKAFEDCADIDGIIVVARTDEIEYMRFELLEFTKLYGIVEAGQTRAESSYRGLCAVPHGCETVAIHDAARCLVTSEGVSRVLEKARAFGAATAATAITDTVKKTDSNGCVLETLDRKELRAVQTPQAFEYRSIMAAFSALDAFTDDITDDNMVYERFGGRVYTVDIGGDNIKITEPKDLLLAELILKERKNV